ncbi:hypothetical protein POM88_054372 [Heracleum sosnowskyi]|uniref:Uncharacterized protein n=1 Tax=Heracleum sosnowskyi TaxID=360622 RepID=A0AAD8GNA4_9APIA|nr:hypothetical protein POM88_054372 [Heracleum sosnowskyi]
MVVYFFKFYGKLLQKYVTNCSFLKRTFELYLYRIEVGVEKGMQSGQKIVFYREADEVGVQSRQKIVSHEKTDEAPNTVTRDIVFVLQQKEERTLHDVSIEDEMHRKQQAAQYFSTEAAYDAYGNVYAQPQVQTSIHQAAVAAYGAYLPTYTVQQSYPHQTYVQATTPATLAPEQQPAAAIAPQAYYGTYKKKL